MIRTRSILAVCAATLVLGLAAASPAATSAKYAPGTYRVSTDRLTVYVDAYPASLHGKDPYIPLRIAVLDEGKGAPIRIDTESFTLTGPDARSEAPASYKAFMDTYRKRNFDESLFRSRPMTLDSRFARDRQLVSRFFPAPGRGTRIARVELGASRWFEDVIYFKRPASLQGVFTLHLAGRGLEEPIAVKFRIDEGHGSKERSRAS